MRLWFGNRGLGPNILGPLRYLLPYNLLFHKSACVHDYLYSISANKEKADEMFYRMCKEVSKNKIQLFFAFLYYEAVYKYGYLFRK